MNQHPAEELETHQEKAVIHCLRVLFLPTFLFYLLVLVVVKPKYHQETAPRDG